MPYSISKVSGGRFAVKTTATGKVHGRHATKAAAEAQMRAIYANSGPEAKGGKKSD